MSFSMVHCCASDGDRNLHLTVFVKSTCPFVDYPSAVVNVHVLKQCTQPRIFLLNKFHYNFVLK